MRILYITHSCPYPPNKGDRIRSFNLLRHLSSQYEVALIYPSFSPSEVEKREVLQQYCDTVYPIQFSPFFSKFKCLLALLKGESLTLAYFQSKKLKQKVDREHFDLAVADCSSMAPYVLALSQPKIVDFVDVDSEKWKIYSKKASFPLTWIYHLESQRLRLYEEEIVNRTHACLVTSEQERKSLPPESNVVVVPNGIDFNYFHPNRSASSPECSTLLFMGAMDYFANIDGVLFFHKRIFPLILQEIPDVKFIIAGMNPTKEIRRLEGPNTIVTGLVPDMRVYLNGASVCVVPLRIARGVQNKVLEAMAMKVPVVATSVANEGIHAQDGREILLGDSPEAFGKAVLTLLEDLVFSDSLAVRARQFVEREFSWDRSFEIVDNVIVHALEVMKGNAT